MVFLKEFFDKVDFEKNQQMTKKHAKLSSRQRDKACPFDSQHKLQMGMYVHQRFKIILHICTVLPES